MTIIRGPQPNENFQILPNATARDKRLSFRARGLLVLMLSYPPDWKFNRDWLARQTDGEGVTAVRTALTELETCGYLVRRRITVDGRFDWAQTVYRSPQAKEAADQPIGGKPAGGKSTDGNPPSKEVSHEDSHEDASHSPTFGGRDDSESEPGESWRAADIDLFRDLLGDKLRSDGTRWKEGVFDIDSFYNAYRKSRGHRWPGRRLEKIANDEGLDYWLMNEGLEQL